MTTKKKQAQEEKLNLEKILSDMDEDIVLTDAKELTENLPLPTLKKTNYDEIYHLCEERASDIINSSIRFFLDKEAIRDSYIKNKIFADKLSIATILFQIEVAKISIIKILEQMDEGELRNIGKISELQTSQMNNTKHLIQAQTIIENSYRTITDELNVKKRLLLDNKTEDGDYLEVVGEVEEEKQTSPMGLGHKQMLMNLHNNIVKNEKEFDYKEID